MSGEFKIPPLENDPNQERKESIAKELEALSNRLGLPSSELMSELEQRILNNPEQAALLMGEWQSNAEQLIDALPEQEKINAQLGLVIRQAAVLQKAGMKHEYNQTIEQAIDLAYQLGQDEVVQELLKF